MLSVQVTAPGQLVVGEVPRPEAADQALVRVRLAGICGTDVKILAGQIPVDHPRILGHEVVGEVVAPEPDAVVAHGQRVLVDPAISCGRCATCWAGRTHLCPHGGLMGRDVDGGFATFVTAPRSRLVPLPSTVGEAASSLLQVLGTCVHALRPVAPFPEEVAAVVGLGVSGLLLVQLLRARDTTVVGVTRSPHKRALAAALGASAVASPDEAEAVVRRVSGGRGAGIVVEAVGSEAALSQAIALARPGAQIVAYGIGGAVTPASRYELYLKELVVHHPRAAQPDDYRQAVVLACSASLQLEALVTHRFELVEADAAFAAVQAPGSLKVLMTVP
jgi:2-desacetyl-2-hydroxyethyl bacteriochlorophyllide A dehydrogenase